MANTEAPDVFPPSGSITFVFLLLLSCSISAKGKADFSVSAPGQPVLALVGKSVELQCRMSLSISAEHMEVRWYREQQSPAVHLLKEGREVPQEQMTEYRGRTTFLTAGLAQGHTSLTIHNVTVFDNGTFHCMFKDGMVSANTTLWLKVAGLGSKPTIQVYADRGAAIEAQCTSQGWYPEPQVEWRDFRGQALPSRTNRTASPATGLFAVVSNVTVQDRAVRGLSCSISSPLLPETREARRHLPVTGFAQLSRSSPSMAWRTVLPMILTVVGLVAAGATCLFWKRQRDRDRAQLEEETLCGEEEEPLSQGWPEDVVYVSPSLDPDTASPKLTLSEDGKTVRRLFFEQELLDAPGRFDLDPCVLGREQFSAGTYYWEVQVGHRKAWNLGVCLESLDRKGRIPKAPQHGLWALELYRKAFWALAFPRVRLYPSEPLQQVGIFLDCDAGRISFYNAGNRSLIYAFSGLSFSAPLRPFFCLWTHDPSPLTICSERQPPKALGSPQGEGQNRVGILLQQDP